MQAYGRRTGRTRARHHGPVRRRGLVRRHGKDAARHHGPTQHHGLIRRHGKDAAHHHGLIRRHAKDAGPMNAGVRKAYGTSAARCRGAGPGPQRDTGPATGGDAPSPRGCGGGRRPRRAPRYAPNALDFPFTGFAPASRCGGTRSRAGSL